MTTNKWWIVTVVSAFASVISFFQVNSAWADAHHFNAGWVFIGIATGLAACYSLYKVSRDWGGGSQP